MNNVNQTEEKKNESTSAAPKKGYRSALRDEQALYTKTKIKNALMELFQASGSPEMITYKEVAKKAGITEMTVFRHCPQRSDLLRLLWEGINAKLGDQVVMPQSAEDLLALTPALYKGFGAHSAMIEASLTTPQGREMRASINRERRKAFTGIVSRLNATLPKKRATRYASILQLLHSVYTWDSLRSQWDMGDQEIAEVAQAMLSILIHHIKKEKPS